MRRTLLLALAAAALLAPSSAQATTLSSYCSTSGDVCYGVFREKGEVVFRISTAARYFSRYQLCVTPPRGERECHDFAIKLTDRGMYGSRVRWALHYRVRGSGTYRVRWSQGGNALGRSLSFRR